MRTLAYTLIRCREDHKPVRITSILRQFCTMYAGEPMWAYMGNTDNHEFLMRLCKNLGTSVTTLKDHTKLTIEITITL